MKLIAYQFTYPIALAVAAVLIAFMVLASPSLSASPSPTPDPATTGTTSKADRVEARINELHTKLMITPAQEELWSNVTRVMRENAKIMDALINKRLEKASTMNAVDDLKSYAEIAEAHANDLKQFIPVFEPLYAGMSDAQKKNADTLFHHRGHGKSKSKAKVK